VLIQKKRFEKIYFLTIFLYILILYLRSPQILLEGRFFAEEGSIFWSFSLANSFLDTLLYTPIIQGYFGLNTNIQILLSNLFPLQYSPLVTVWTSIFISLLPSIAYFNLTKSSETDLHRLLVSISFLLLPSLNFLEVFANSINSQTYLGVTSFIIIIKGFNRDTNKLHKLELFILFLSFFSGYYSLILLPVLFARLLIEKNKKIILPIIFGFISGIINLNVLFYALNNKALYEGKLDSNTDLNYFLSIFKKSLVLNLFTEKYFNNKTLGNILLFLFLILTIYIFMSYNVKNKIEFFYIYLALVLEVILIFIGQAGETYDQRYAVVVPTIVSFILINFLKSYKLEKYFLIFLIFIGCLNFNFQRSDYFIDCKEFCISWQDQISSIDNNPIIVHWPLGEGDPYWYTNFKDPKPNPAPFQIEIFGDGYLQFYEVTLVDIFNSNFN